MGDEHGAGPPGIDGDLGMVAAEIAALRSLDADPEKSNDSARIYDFSIRWGVLMSGRLKRIEHYYRTEELTGDQTRRYRNLRSELKEAGEQIERLGLTRPTVPLEDEGKPPRG